MLNLVSWHFLTLPTWRVKYLSLSQEVWALVLVLSLKPNCWAWAVELLLLGFDFYRGPDRYLMPVPILTGHSSNPVVPHRKARRHMKQRQWKYTRQWLDIKPCKKSASHRVAGQPNAGDLLRTRSTSLSPNRRRAGHWDRLEAVLNPKFKAQRGKRRMPTQAQRFMREKILVALR